MRGLKEKNSTIDFIKGVSILCVLITHYNWSDSQRLRYGFPFHIAMAVPVFMIISGYTWTLSFQNDGIFSLDKCFDSKLFLKKYLRFTFPYGFLWLADIAYMVLIKAIKGYEYSVFDYVSLVITGGPGPGAYYYPILMQLLFIFPFIYIYI